MNDDDVLGRYSKELHKILSDNFGSQGMRRLQVTRGLTLSQEMRRQGILFKYVKMPPHIISYGERLT